MEYRKDCSRLYVAWVTLLYVLYAFGFPVLVLLASPYVLLRHRSGCGSNGEAAGRIKTNYMGIVRLWERIGYRLPVLR